MLSLPTHTGTRPIEVYALATGQLSHPDRWLFEDGDADLKKARHVYPDFSFLISHHSGKNVLFDLGLPKDLNLIPEVIRGLSDITQPKACEDAVDILSRGPVSPSSIDAVIFSHLHFDHIGDCTKFPLAQMIAGSGSHAASAPGWPVNPKSPFASAPIQHPKYHELSFERDAWSPLGPFERAHDFFGDGSLFLIDTPGHMPGHLGALALTGPDEWVFMGGDCCHHRSLLVGSRPMSVTVGPAGQKCFHREPEVAEQTIRKIRTLEKMGKVFVALSHDSFLVGSMPEYPVSLSRWSASGWKKGLDEILVQNYPSQ